MADYELKQDPHYAFGYYVPGNNQTPESREKDLANTNWIKFGRIPRLKHNWTVGFELSSGATELLATKIGSDRVNELLSELTLRAQSVDLPTWNVSTQSLNQYNKHRLVHTKVEWQQVQVKFFDTIDNAFQALLMAYMEYYFPNNFNNVGFEAMQPDQLSLDFKGEYGYASVDDFNNNFFITMIVNREYGGWVDQTLLINPKITAVQHDTLDYTDAGSPVTWTITIQYESVVFRPTTMHEDQAQYADSNSAANEFGGEQPDASSDELAGFPPEERWDAEGEAGMDEQEPGWTTGAPGDAITGPGNKPPANLAEQIGDKISNLKNNIVSAGSSVIDKLGGGNIGVGKAINPTTIAAALSVASMVKQQGVGGLLKNPIAAAGVAVTLAKQLPPISGIGGKAFGSNTSDAKINQQASIYEQATLDKAAANGVDVGSITNLTNLSPLQKFIRLG